MPSIERQFASDMQWQIKAPAKETPRTVQSELDNSGNESTFVHLFIHWMAGQLPAEVL